MFVRRLGLCDGNRPTWSLNQRPNPWGWRKVETQLDNEKPNPKDDTQTWGKSNSREGVPCGGQHKVRSSHAHMQQRAQAQRSPPLPQPRTCQSICQDDAKSVSIPRTTQSQSRMWMKQWHTSNRTWQSVSWRNQEGYSWDRQNDEPWCWVQARPRNQHYQIFPTPLQQTNPCRFEFRQRQTLWKGNKQS